MKFTRVLQEGSRGEDVKYIQTLLNKFGYNIAADGIFGGITREAVKQFQASIGMTGYTGIVDLNIWQSLEKNTPVPNNSTVLLCADKYIQMREAKKDSGPRVGVTLHHTASGPDAEDVINVWNQDGRGPVGTHFIIGRDGKIIQTMDVKTEYAYHIHTPRMGFSMGHNEFVNKMYIGIELCSWGCLVKKGDKFYDLSEKVQVNNDEVVELDNPFRTYRYWQEYTDAQIIALEKLLKDLAQVFKWNYKSDYYDLNIDFKSSRWLEMSWDAMNLKQKITSHTSFENGKVDIFPQKSLGEMLARLTQ